LILIYTLPIGEFFPSPHLPFFLPSSIIFNPSPLLKRKKRHPTLPIFQTRKKKKLATMAPSEDGVIPSHKRSQDAASISGSSSSSDDSARRRKRRERKERKRKNGETAVAAVNGAKPNAFAQRRNSLAKASRDPRDEPVPKKRRASTVPEEGGAVVKTSRSPSPVIDFDGLSRPSMFLPYFLANIDLRRAFFC
jgi:hypothetical protein